MANPTSNFGWQMPTSTDLVTDLPADFEVFGQAVDTDFVDLLGGTTGQILSKTSNTDLDFTWITPNPGDITEVTAGTGLTGGGTSGAVTLSFDQANFGGGQYAAGKNKIINGDFGVWQRGTSTTTDNTYLADRWLVRSNATFTASQQTFTLGTAPVSGYEGQFFLRMNKSAGGSYASIAQRIESVRTFAGQTITLSFWAKANTSATIVAYLSQDFGSGGSGGVIVTNTNVNITSSWVRYSVTANVPSISGKTVGTSSFLNFETQYVNSGALTLDIWGVQVEAASVASPFQTATGTIQGELAACQRYYYRQTSITNYGQFTSYSPASTTTTIYGQIQPAVTMRTGATSVEFSSLRVNDAFAANPAVSAITIGEKADGFTNITITSSGLTQGRVYKLEANNSASAYIGLSAEL